MKNNILVILGFVFALVIVGFFIIISPLIILILPFKWLADSRVEVAEIQFGKPKPSGQFDFLKEGLLEIYKNNKKESNGNKANKI